MKVRFFLFLFAVSTFFATDSSSCEERVRTWPFNNIGFYIIKKMQEVGAFLPSTRWHFGQQKVEEVEDYEPCPSWCNVVPLQRTSDSLPPRPPLKKLKPAIYEEPKGEETLLSQIEMALSEGSALEKELLSSKSTAAEGTDRRISQNLDAEDDAKMVCKNFVYRKRLIHQWISMVIQLTEESGLF